MRMGSKRYAKKNPTNQIPVATMNNLLLHCCNFSQRAACFGSTGHIAPGRQINHAEIASKIAEPVNICNLYPLKIIKIGY